MKFIKAGTLLVALVVLALEIGCVLSWNHAVGSPLIMLAPPLLFIWPLSRVLRRRFTRTTITGDRLRCESGVTSKTTRNIQISKIQDVRVDQSMWQRLFNVGDIAIETAGEASRLTVHNVDNPQALADDILNRSQRAAITGNN